MPSPPRSIVLMGDTNVGKTAIFSRLTRHREVDVNMPGSTQEVHRAHLSKGPRSGSLTTRVARALFGRGGKEPIAEDAPVVVDTPGTTSLFAFTEEELVTRAVLLEGTAESVVLVANARDLRKALALCLQVAELELPVVIALNMMDEAESRGIDIDSARLAGLLGVEVVETVAIEGHGLGTLAAALPHARVPTRRVSFPEPLASAIDELTELLGRGPFPARAMALLLLGGDPDLTAWTRAHYEVDTMAAATAIVARTRASYGAPLDLTLLQAIYDKADRLAARVVQEAPRPRQIIDRIGRAVMRPATGLPILLAVFALMFLWIGFFGAQFLVDLLDVKLFGGVVTPVLEGAVSHIPWEFVRSAILDEDFGLIPTGIFLSFGIVMPVLFCFYLFFAILEDSGYLPRMSVLLDRVLRWMGLNGRGVMPLILGLSCITMAIITTRMLPSKKERLILTFMLVLSMPCAPLLSVMLVILADLPFYASLTVFGIIASQTLLMGWLAGKVLPGGLPPLIMEIPPMRLPKAGSVLRKTVRRLYLFMKEAVPIFLLASILLFLFDWFGGLTVLEHAMEPLVEHAWGLPEESVRVLLRTIIRREAGAAELSTLSASFTNLQVVVAMVVMTFLFPCINSLLVMVKEHGIARTLVILGAVTIYTIIIGAALYHGSVALGVTFT